ncbi:MULTISPECIES: hypothetical protein [unclassified Acinetobacter]|uniref:hypothetical protein n=1 Tax=unclassified Acinetobacter TaxID=196816 RepID=UPI00293498C0|nr:MULTISPECIES: hypothetical protein [unclassified Acinetobacter]WOE31635.1 hypothetical protein QSG84_15250 [Acinetobacter sp. SAAs470]WOE37100.1 hypothetical protein QSG86_08915 [Acinetobacter sp. SAAs474]
MLKIATVLKNLSLYQVQYLDILQDSKLYFSQVEGAYLHIWPFQPIPLYLGDLLQLWLSDKWIEHLGHKPLINTILRSHTQIDSSQDHYVYAIEANLLTGKNHVVSWSKLLGQNQYLDLTNALQYYCVFKALKRPKLKTS